MHADPVAFRTKYRTMAADPFAFFRGTACLFYADITRIFREGPGVRVLGRDERRRPPGYNVLVEGHSQALDNDVVLSMKQANVPAVSRFVDTTDVDLDWSDLDDPGGDGHPGRQPRSRHGEGALRL